MRGRILLVGVVAWAVGTLALRVGGQYMLPVRDSLQISLLYVGSMPLVAAIVVLLCRSLKVPREDSLAAAAFLTLPTLLLDPFTTAFFSVVFPNMSPDAAASFAGWMLCCAGAGLAGGFLRQGSR